MRNELFGLGAFYDDESAVLKKLKLFREGQERLLIFFGGFGGVATKKNPPRALQPRG